MGLFAVKPSTDARLAVDAYISHGTKLYRVAFGDDEHLILEDALLSHGDRCVCQTTPVFEVLAEYELVERTAP